MIAWKTAKVGDYLRMKHLETGVWKTVKVTERQTKRGRHGYIRLTLRFANGHLHNLHTKDFAKFRVDKADRHDRYYYDCWTPPRQEAPRQEAPPRSEVPNFDYDEWRRWFRGEPRTAPPVDDSFSVFMKYAGIDRMPNDVAQLNEAKKKAVFALHPDRSGFDSHELFLKAMRAYDTQKRMIS